ncbi:MAG: hypothetical protein ACKO7B_06700, partial [Flavobacteriales bacterium]
MSQVLISNPFARLQARALLFVAVFCSTFTVSAQDSTAVTGYDPIVASLDSLLNQSFIQRLSASGSMDAGFQNDQIPTYADDIYRARIRRIQTPIALAYNEEVKE